jgi:hypothetical protein
MEPWRMPNDKRPKNKEAADAKSKAKQRAKELARNLRKKNVNPKSNGLKRMRQHKQSKTKCPGRGG